LKKSNILNILRIIEQAEQIIEEKGIDKSRLAQTLGLSSRYVADIRAGRSKKPSADFVLALINKLNFNPVWLETGEGKIFSKPQSYETASNSKNPIPFSVSELPEKAFLVPLLDQKLSADSGYDLPEDDSEKGLIAVPSYLSKYGKNIKALTVEGDSMYPTLHREDMVVFDSCGWSGESVYAVRMNGKGSSSGQRNGLGKLSSYRI
jgi:phage repressor protein C with HTH and peptisase S24 domain